jgi:ABC-type branched-subunit amino acid transport system ATPase component
LTVLENVIVGTDWSRRSSHSAIDRAEAILEDAGLSRYASAEPAQLPFGIQRRVEIVRALVPGAPVLLLDEPAGGLSREEADALGDWLVSLAESGVALVLVEHNVRMVQRICAEVTVLAQGRLIFTGPPAEMADSRVVVESYLGSSW